MKKGFLAYANEIDSLTIGSDLTVENRLDRISIYGSVDITKDKEGLKYAYELKRVVDAAIEVLKNENLPEHVKIVGAETIANPFNF